MPHLHLATFVSVHPRTARMRRRQARALRPWAARPSKAAEMRYRRGLLALVDLLIAADAELAQAIRPHWPQVTDARPPQLDAELERLAAKFGDIKMQARRLAKQAAELTLGDVDDRLAKAIRQSIGVNVRPALTGHGRIATAMRKATLENVALITSIPEKHLGLVRKVVTESFTEGARWEDIVDRIQRIGRVTKDRAQLIARDQTSKMTSAFNEVRQTDMGIKRYRWSGILDSRERPSHRKMEGKICRWDQPPVVDGEPVHPGQAVNCRCVPIALINIDDIEGTVAA